MSDDTYSTIDIFKRVKGKRKDLPDLQEAMPGTSEPPETPSANEAQINVESSAKASPENDPEPATTDAEKALPTKDDPYEKERQQRESRRQTYLAVGIIVGLIIAAGLAGLISWLTTREVAPPPRPDPDPGIPTNELFRIDCNPEREGGVEILDKDACEARGCVYLPSNYTQYYFVPSCFVAPDSEEFGFRVVEGPSDTAQGESWILTRINELGIYDVNFQNVTFEYMMTDDHLIRFKFTVLGEEPSFEVPMTLKTGSMKAKNPKYIFEVTNEDPFHFRVIRKNSGTVLWDTSIGGLVLSRQFLQIATHLPSKNVYGFGEHLHRSFRHDFTDFKTWPIFPRDQPPNTADADKEYNLYSHQPFYEVLEDDGQSHGVLLLNSHAMDVTLTPAPILVYRTIGGLLDFYIFVGPTPENVIQQYTSAIGRPMMPPYWALGYQLTRYGYKDTVHMQKAVERTLAGGIPLDVQYADIDHMDRQRIFTIDPVNFSNISAHFAALRESGMRTVVILDPCVEIPQEDEYLSYTRGRQADIYLKWDNISWMPSDDYRENNDTMMGYVWPEWKVVFPDFFNPDTEGWWTQELVLLREQLEFDGIWLDMNEPANFGTNEERPWNWPADRRPYWSLKCPESPWDDPPYRTKAAYQYDNPEMQYRERLSAKTLCMQGIHADNMLHYHAHSLYGWKQAQVNLEAVRAATGSNLRGFQITRAGFVGTGAYAGRWLGDNTATWLDMKLSIIGILESNLFGIPYIGADICGFFGNTTEELCSRWHQLGAFYTFARNHNHEEPLDQDPAAISERTTRVAREAMLTRYTLLPYLYTLFHDAHVRGGTVIRPLMHEFPTDETTWGLYEQFLWGHALLINPILTEEASEHTYYLPAGRWYNYYGGGLLSAEGQEVIVQTSIRWRTEIPLAVRGGYIIPTQEPAANTHLSRQNGFGLIVALDELDGYAYGTLFLDDGESLDTYGNGEYVEVFIRCKSTSLELSVTGADSLPQSFVLTSVKVLGVSVAEVLYVDGGSYGSFELDGEVLDISGLSLDLTKSHHIEWRAVRFGRDAEALRVDCCPDSCTSGDCEARVCLWGPVGAVPGVPSCYIDTAVYGYDVTRTIPPFDYLMWKGESSMFGGDVPDLLYTLEEYTNVVRLKFFVENEDRYEVPVPINLPDVASDQVKYERLTTPFSFTIQRYTGDDTGTMLFDTTSVGGLTFADQYIQIAAKIPTANVYGFGEHLHSSIRRDMNFKTWSMFARDQPPTAGANLYSAMPFYICIEDDGKAHGVLFRSSQAMEVSLSPAPAVTFRTTGGILDVYMILGNNPSEVISRYHSLIGTAFLPPYWSLGFHLSRYRYDVIDNLKDAVARTTDAGIPLDVVHLDIDSQDERKAFTWDKDSWSDLPEYIDALHGDSIKVVSILNPFLITNETEYEPFRLARRRNAFVMWPEGDSPDSDILGNDIMLGYVWPKGRVAFVDFFKENATLTWVELISTFFSEELRVDGLWLDMNEPANFGTNEDRAFNWPVEDEPWWTLKCPPGSLDDPPYRPRSAFGPRLSDKTICMVGQHNDGALKHYDVHNLYGHTMAEPSLQGIQAASGKRGLVISRSLFPGSGQYAGHWLGDNDSSWLAMRQSIIGILEFNLFGVPFVGADICGYFGNATMELCERWHQLGAFYPFARNHNGGDTVDQDPGVYGDISAYNTRQVYLTRYRLLPYLYSLFYVAHSAGGTVARGLFEEFPADPIALAVDEQFLWGPGLLITPVLRQGAREVLGYFPDARWFDFYTGAELAARGRYLRLDAPIDTIPLHVRGGSIIITQEPDVNTVSSRTNALGLLVAFDDSVSATGPFFWDDGVSADTTGSGDYTSARINMFSGNLSMTNDNRRSSDLNRQTVQTIRMLGLQAPPTVAASSPGLGEFSTSFNPETKEFIMAAVELPMNEDFWILFSIASMEDMSSHNL